MKETQNNSQPNNFDSDIDFVELFNNLWKGRWIILCVTTFISIIGVIYSLNLPNIYESKATITPADSSSSISRSMQGYAGLAGIAGISIPSGIDDSNSVIAKEKLQSLSFFEMSLLPKIYLPNLMAINSWDPKTNTITYDERIFNKQLNAWVREFSYPMKQKPSAQESYEVFKSSHFTISEDKATGFITIKIKHQSPFIAKKWLAEMIESINDYYKQKDQLESERSINFLNNQIAVTSLSEVKEVISQLIQEETKKLALIESRESYVFEYIDPPAVMEAKSDPKRALICIIFALLGGMFSIFYVILKNYFFNQEEENSFNVNEV